VREGGACIQGKVKKIKIKNSQLKLIERCRKKAVIQKGWKRKETECDWKEEGKN
jgi:ribosome-binding protein aMBF1 (putative translation factor)